MAVYVMEQSLRRPGADGTRVETLALRKLDTDVPHRVHESSVDLILTQRQHSRSPASAESHVIAL